MNLSPNIVIKTDRCKLRITKKEDILFIFSATRYKGFNDGMLWDAPENEAELIETFKDGVTKAWHERQSYSLTICDKKIFFLYSYINNLIFTLSPSCS